jgi:hypothetical protein
MGEKSIGRPTVYTEELAAQICDRLAHGESLRSICDDGDMPHRQTIFNWLRSNQSFFDQYAHAREIAADIAFDEMQEIADNATPVDVQVAKLRVDTLKWRLARQSPKKYGERQKLEHVGQDDGPIQQSVFVAPDQYANAEEWQKHAGSGRAD